MRPRKTKKPEKYTNFGVIYRMEPKGILAKFLPVRESSEQFRSFKRPRTIENMIFTLRMTQTNQPKHLIYNMIPTKVRGYTYDGETLDFTLWHSVQSHKILNDQPTNKTSKTSTQNKPTSKP